MKVRTKVSTISAMSAKRAGANRYAGTWRLAGLLLACFVLASIWTPSKADGMWGVPASSRSSSKTVSKAKAQKAATARERARKATFSLDFINTDIVDVLKALSTQSGVNIVVTSGAKGTVTLSLHNVTLEQALGLVCATNGLEYAWVDVAYVVGKPEELRGLQVKNLSSRAVTLHQISPKYAQEILGKVVPEVTVSYQEGSPVLVLVGTEGSLERAQRTLAEIDVPTPPTTKRVSLGYAKAEKVLDILNTAVPEANVQLAEGNALIITADGVNMDQAMSLIKALDVLPSSAEATVVLYEIKYAKADELKKAVGDRFGKDLVCIDAPRSNTPAIQQTSESNAGGTTILLGGPQVTGGSSSSTGTSNVAGTTIEAARVERLILMGAEYTVQQALDLLKTLDVTSKQVKIEAIVTSINSNKMDQLGIDWDQTGGLGTVGSAVSIFENGSDPRELKVGGFKRSPLSFEGILHALQTKGDAKILSKPRVLTLDGRQVSFRSVERILYPITVGFSTTGTAIQDTREVDAGMTLLVTPQVSSDGWITLTLSPTFSTVTFETIGGQRLPNVNERTAIATVRVKSGESIVIAGLIQDTVSHATSKIPLLGDIPLLGKLFRSDVKEHTNNDLVIMVTPTLLVD